MNTCNRISSVLAGLTLIALAQPALAEQGLAGSSCEAAESGYSKQEVGGFGVVWNKSTSGVLKINCAIPVAVGSSHGFYVDYTKRDTQAMSCTLHRRDFSNLSGATTTKSTTAKTVSWFEFPASTMDDYNSMACILPKSLIANKAGWNGINGVYVLD